MRHEYELEYEYNDAVQVHVVVYYERTEADDTE